MRADYIFLYSVIQVAIHASCETQKQRQWWLSLINAAFSSGVGIAGLLWGFDAATAVTAVQALQAYLIVDLAYNGVSASQPLLEFWVHHPVYIVLLEAAANAQYAPLVANYFILELPNIVRSAGQLDPRLRSGPHVTPF